MYKLRARRTEQNKHIEPKPTRRMSWRRFWRKFGHEFAGTRTERRVIAKVAWKLERTVA